MESQMAMIASHCGSSKRLEVAFSSSRSNVEEVRNILLKHVCFQPIYSLEQKGRPADQQPTYFLLTLVSLHSVQF